MSSCSLLLQGGFRFLWDPLPLVNEQADRLNLSDYHRLRTPATQQVSQVRSWSYKKEYAFCLKVCRSYWFENIAGASS